MRSSAALSLHVRLMRGAARKAQRFHVRGADVAPDLHILSGPAIGVVIYLMAPGRDPR
jgi:hypothetical protein